MRTSYRFTAQDRADHDRLRKQIRRALRRKRAALYDAAQWMAEVRDRELWKLDRRESLEDWIWFHFGIKERQARKYLAIREGLTREQVENSRYNIDMLESVAVAPAALRAILLELGEEVAGGKRLRDEAIVAGRRAGEAVLDTLGEEFAEAETARVARAWTPGAAPEPLPIEQLEAALKLLVKVDGSLEALVAQVGQDPQAEGVLGSIRAVAERMQRKAAVDCQDEPAADEDASDGTEPEEAAVDCHDESASAAADRRADPGQTAVDDDDIDIEADEDDIDEEEAELDDPRPDEKYVYTAQEVADHLGDYDGNNEAVDHESIALAIVAGLEEQEQKEMSRELKEVALGNMDATLKQRLEGTWERLGLEEAGVAREDFDEFVKDLCDPRRGDLYAVMFLAGGKPLGWEAELDYLQRHRFLMSDLVANMMRRSWRPGPHDPAEPDRAAAH